MRKILLTLLALLSLGVSGAWAQTYTISFDTGTFYIGSTSKTKPTGTNVQTINTWKSTSTSPLLTLTTAKATANAEATDGNNMVIDANASTYFYLHNDTYTLTVPAGYSINSYSITASTASGNSYTINKTSISTNAESPTVISVENIDTQTTTFTVGGTKTATTWVKVTSFTVEVGLVASSIEGKCVTGIGEKVTSLASISENAYYIFEWPFFSNALSCTNNNDVYLPSSGAIAIASLISTSANIKYVYRFHKKSEGVYELITYDGKYLQKCSGSNGNISSIKSESKAAQVTLTLDGTSFKPTTTANDITYHIDRGGSNLGWYKPNAGSARLINIYPVTLMDKFSVTYKAVDGSGNEMKAATATNIQYGTTPSAPSSLTNGSFVTLESNYYDNASLSGDPITQITSATTLYVGYSINTSTCPVTFSTVESPVWYYLQLRNIYPSAASADATNPIPSSSKISTSGGAWLFIGDPYKFYLYNKLTGKYLEKSDAASGAANGTQFTSTPFEWQMSAHDAGDKSFRIYTKATAANATPTHIFSNTTSIMWLNWNGTGSGEVGGKFVVSDYSDEFKDQVAANIKPYFDKFDSDGEVYFGITSATNTAYRTAYTAALSSCTEDNYSTLYTNVVSNGLKLPTDGYYRLKNIGDGTKYLAYNGGLTVSTSTSPTSILYIDAESNGSMSIVLQGNNYIQMPAGLTEPATVSTTPMLFTATIVTPGAVSLIGPNPVNAFQCFGVSGSSITGQSGSSTSAQWSFEPATSFTGTLTNAKDNTGTTSSYATLCVPYEVTAITGAQAYKPTISGRYVVPGDGATTIVAGTPVILIGAEDAGSYTATIGSGYASTPVAATASDVLTGTFTSTSIDCTAATGTIYVLGFDEDNDNRIGFYHVNNASFPLSANRAYLVPGSVSSVKGFAINFDEETGIQSAVDGQLGDGAIYNLAGQRVNQATKGLYIVNGKKVIVK